MHAEFFFIVFTTKICFLLQNHNFSPIKTSTAAGPHSFNWSKNIQILELRTCEHDTLIETQTPGSWKYDENYFNQNYFNPTLCQHERSADKISLWTFSVSRHFLLRIFSGGASHGLGESAACQVLHLLLWFHDARRHAFKQCSVTLWNNKILSFGHRFLQLVNLMGQRGLDCCI